ncbi:MAG: potassium transporter Kup [Phycisphaerales bacterium]|nr:potassium transporter Kup [Hyphomonadaceae bacterium]
MAQAPAEAPQPNASGSGRPGGGRARAIAHGGFWTLLIGSIGVVYGDIGTSPLYAFKESFIHVLQDGTRATSNEVFGIVSLIFWSLMIVVTLKYVVIVLQMDNKGEGGTLSLMALAQRALGRRTPLLFLVGVAGASLFYGDALITPAISVLSAVEGLKVVPGLEEPIEPFILPIAIGILVGLFAIQSRGTGVMGRFFGPITAFWFVTMGLLGALQIAANPAILQALNPIHAVSFMVDHGFLTFVVLGSVFLAVTGAEALYADMGHFGRRPIRLAWVGLVLPALTLNYLGQGAFVLGQLDALNIEYALARDAARAVGANSVVFNFSPFFEMAPEIIRLPLVVLATAATVIASQAVISGAFSLTQQAIQLGLLPRMEIRRTSETQAGQIYIPQINWLLLAGVLILTLGFGSSTRLAAAYGIAITGEMLMSTIMVFIVLWKLWKRPLALALVIVAPFAVIESIFLASNLQRVWNGGFVPILLAMGLVVLMWTWVRGTRLLAETVRRDEPLAKLFETLSHHPPHRVRGAAIFLTGDPDVAPAALMHNLKHNQVLHEQIIILTVKTVNAPRAPENERVKVEDFLPDVKRVTLTFGFMETPNVVKALTEARKHGLKFDIMKTSFFLSRRTIVPSEKSGMPLWQDHLFIFLARNATNATDFFHIPSGRAVELGNQVMV